MTAAIYFHPEAYPTSGPKLMGRNAAGESFPRGFLAYRKADAFWVQDERKPEARHTAWACADVFCSLVAVDVDATAQAFTRFFASPQLRKQMGEAGRQRAREGYAWATIIPQYEALWAHLGEMRQAQAPALVKLGILKVCA